MKLSKEERERRLKRIAEMPDPTPEDDERYRRVSERVKKVFADNPDATDDDLDELLLISTLKSLNEEKEKDEKG